MQIRIFNGCGKGAIRSYQQSCRAETRPNLFKEVKEDRAVPCVGLTVASDLNLAVWSLFISHLVGGITDQNLGNPHLAQPVLYVLLCFARSY